MTYPPKGETAATRAWLEAALQALDRAGLSHGIVSVGGTPDMYRAGELGVSTEHRPGTYVYSDRYMVAHGIGTFDDCALTVVSTVVSRAAPDRGVIDAGSKTLSSDPMGLEGHGMLREAPRARLAGLSEEHGHLDLADSPERPRVGDRVTIVPNHACAVSNLHDEIVAHRGGRVERVFKVAARGKVR
jgi:D-serine deaminase-like pyridoxal phosphate-dependent protein